MDITEIDLQIHFQSIMDTAEKGEDVILKLHGKARAKIIPFESEAETQESTGFIGMWKDRSEMEDPIAYIRQLRKGRFE